jgi:hypothetical protein
MVRGEAVTPDPTRERCGHDLARGTCSICSGSERARRQQSTTSECRSCHAEVIWVFTEKGRRMPIDAEPSADGRFRKERVDVVDGNQHRIVHFVRDDELEANTAPLYLSHFATCPDADQHRRG